MLHGTVPLDKGAIHYRQTGDPQAPAIFLLHGNSMSGRCFETQLTSSLQRHFRMIAMDLPGHGDSERLSLSDYNLPAYAKLVSRVITELHIPKAILVGWSLGGHVLLQATQYLPQASGLMIIGTPPLAKLEDALQAFLPNPSSVIYQDEVSKQEAFAFARVCLHPTSNLDCTLMANDVLNSHGQARLGLMQPDVEFTDEVSLARALKMPFAVVLGEGEQLVSLDYINGLNLNGLWQNQVQVLENVGHTPHLESPETFNALLGEFARDCLSR